MTKHSTGHHYQSVLPSLSHLNSLLKEFSYMAFLNVSFLDEN